MKNSRSFSHFIFIRNCKHCLEMPFQNILLWWKVAKKTEVVIDIYWAFKLQPLNQEWKSYLHSLPILHSIWGNNYYYLAITQFKYLFWEYFFQWWWWKFSIIYKSMWIFWYNWRMCAYGLRWIWGILWSSKQQVN